MHKNIFVCIKLLHTHLQMLRNKWNIAEYETVLLLIKINSYKKSYKIFVVKEKEDVYAT